MSYHGCFVDGFLFFFINKDGLKRKVPNYKNLNTSTIHHTIDVTAVRRKDQGDLPNLILPDTIILFIFEHKCLHLTRLLSAIIHKKLLQNLANYKGTHLPAHTKVRSHCDLGSLFLCNTIQPMKTVNWNIQWETWLLVPDNKARDRRLVSRSVHKKKKRLVLKQTLSHQDRLNIRCLLSMNLAANINCEDKLKEMLAHLGFW